MSDGTFRDGYLEGWKAVLGNNAPTPGVPGKPGTPAGKTEYQFGLERGIEDAKKRKAGRSN